MAHTSGDPATALNEALSEVIDLVQDVKQAHRKVPESNSGSVSSRPSALEPKTPAGWADIHNRLARSLQLAPNRAERS